MSVRGAASKYSVIIADPPWAYDNYGMKTHGSAKAHYEEAKVGPITEVNAGRWAKDEGRLLFLWCTGPKAAENIVHDVAEAWGFRLISMAFCWVKVNDRCTGCGQPWDSHERPKPGADFPGRAIGCRGFIPSTYFGIGNYTGGGTEHVWLARSGKRAFAKERARRDIRHTVFAPVREHSQKPEEVQTRIEMLWPGARPRLELYATRQRPKWTCWGRALGQELGPWGVRECVPIPNGQPKKEDASVEA